MSAPMISVHSLELLFTIARAMSTTTTNRGLCVVYYGEPTHHGVVVSGTTSGVVEVNKQPMADCETLEDLVNHLRVPQPHWPVPLTRPIHNPDVPLPTRSDARERRLLACQRKVAEAAAKVEQQRRRVDVLSTVAGRRVVSGKPAPSSSSNQQVRFAYFFEQKSSTITTHHHHKPSSSS